MTSFLAKSRFAIALGLAALTALTSCDGGGGGSGEANADDAGRVTLTGIKYGRLVDIYAYQKVNSSGSADRRATFNRRPVLVEENVVINPGIASQGLFDASGEERPGANYRFQPFDVNTGHDELLILWDNTDDAEQSRFNAALAEARLGLLPVPSAYRGQNTSAAPVPVMPRNAAIVLEFDNDVGVTADFFRVNPAAVQLLEFRGDPAVVSPVDAFEPVSFRVVPKGNTFILDTTVIGGEAGLSAPTNGLPESIDSVTANLRIALPARGSVSDSLFVELDGNENLNGVDSVGRASVIRDFRSGNAADGALSTVADLEPPMIVGEHSMGIREIDTANRVLTLNKRFRQVVVRGRVPFVDGPIGADGVPDGPGVVPSSIPLRSGDIISQEVVDTDGNTFVVRAEILENLEIESAFDDSNVGLTAAGTDGSELVQCRVRVSSLSATDELGRTFSFEESTLPLGAECKVRTFFYNTLVVGGVDTGDFQRIEQFLEIDPAPPVLDPQGNPIPFGSNVDPMASVALRFSEPMDLATVNSLENLFVTDSSVNGTDVLPLLAEPKVASLSIQATRLFDVDRDGTLLRLVPPLGFFHANVGSETYWMHMLLGIDGPRDLGGNQVAIFDSPTQPADSFSVSFTMDQDAPQNLVASVVKRFADADEDGTRPGSIDFFGQFLLLGGRLEAAPATRFSRTADNQNLGGITRNDRGECALPPPDCTPPNAWTQVGGVTVRYNNPRMFDEWLPPAAPNIVPLPFRPFTTDWRIGRVIEPHEPAGSRLQMVYIEDDFDLGYTDPANYLIDVEQMYWSTFADDEPLFDVFDRYSLSLGHSRKRPDLYYFRQDDPTGGPPQCLLAAASLRSSLLTTFTDNVLPGSEMVDVVKDVVYSINPNQAFRTQGTRFLPYPPFQTSYTWRDERLVTWDMGTDSVVGLGGALGPTDNPPNDDLTANIDSPWIPNSPGWVDPTALPPEVGDCYPQGQQYVVDLADFRGDRQLDHNPIALPLLMDFKIYPDESANGLAAGSNAFQVGFIGLPTNFNMGNPGGYYNQDGNPWPWLRVHTTGGKNPLTTALEPVNPDLQIDARGGPRSDAGLGDNTTGIFNAPPGDSHIHWAQADFVRKVSVVTFGFFDSVLPNQHVLEATDLPNLQVNWPGFNAPAGYPDLDSIATQLGTDLRTTDVATVMYPPLSEQPAGTDIVMEVRGAEFFDNANIYDQLAPNGDLFNSRGNLLNPNYACEAFRFASPNPGLLGSGSRVDAQGLTPYVPIDQLDTIRNNGQLPRYLNMRLIMNNNTAVTPAVSPGVDSMAFVYRVAPRQ